MIGSLRKNWVTVTCLSYLFISLACSYIFSVCGNKFFGYSLLWSIPLCLVIFFLFLFFDRSWKIDEHDVARFLNNKYPELEESAELLLAPVPSLPLLQQLQARKNEQVLGSIYKPGIFYKKLSTSLLILLVAAIIGTGLSMMRVPLHQETDIASSLVPAQKIKNEILLPAISSFTVTIQPPSYTRKPVRTQESFSLEAEEGATISWRIKTRSAVRTVQLILNDANVLALQPNNDHTSWTASKPMNASGFYQVKMDTIVSELYKMEMWKDQAPVISLQTPKANTVIDYGEPEKVMLNVVVKDDYGISEVSVAATISSGSGEAVKFEQQQINFDNSFAAQLPQYQLKKSVDLAALGMKPGDELYFYIKAIDNHRQEKRSDVYIVSITDTAQLMSVDGLMNGISVKPEYFRSERQIIIETEQLIKDKDNISEEAFRNRSNNLGIDQKLLRLRYGKFLGEEAESNEDEHLSALGDDPKDFGNAEKVLDAYTDKHDNAEVADFFEIATKNQLKATLTEMWNAELKLRTFVPAEALPYEYKALRLLKDLQQKSRAYVAKTNFTTTPLKPEKRLTADLSKIIGPSKQTNFKSNAGPDGLIRTALSVLEQLKNRGNFNSDPLPVLQQASQQLADKAIAAPSTYLSSLEALKRIIASLQNRSLAGLNDISLVETALQKMISAPVKLPYTNKKPANINLSKEYFKNLKKLNP